MVADGVIDVIMGEAGGRTEAERYADMVAIASVIQNRATLSNLTPKSVVSVKSEFNAYGKALPPGVEAYRSLAEQAWNQVQTTGPVHNATYYATSKAKSGLPDNLTPVTKTAGHEFFADPEGRSFRTSEGFVTPATETHAAMMAGNLVAPQNPYAGLVPPAQTPPVSLPQSAPSPTSRPDTGRTITPGAGLANLAPPTPSRPDGTNYGAVSYAHPSRGPWSAGLVPAVVDAVNMLASDNPRGVGITSAYRSPTHPVEARKASPGQHARGTAFDMDLSGMTNAERAKAVETARMTGATRLGAYSKSPNMMHVDFADTHAPTRGGVYAMMDRSRRNMGRAPDWFTQGLDQVTVPTPTSRPDTMAAPAGVVERGTIPSLGDQSKIEAYEEYGASRSAAPAMPVTTPSPSRPDNFAYSGPKGNFSVGSRASLPASAPVPSSRPPVDPVTVQAIPTPTPAPRSVNPMAPPGIDTMTPQQAATIAEASRGRQAPSLAGIDPRSMAAPMADNTPVAPGFPSAPGFPPAPPSPGRRGARSAATGALAGMAGGLPGALIGAVLGPARDQIMGNIRSNRQGMGRVPLFNGVRDRYRGLGGMFGNMGGLLSPANFSASPYSVGSGYGAIGSTFGGPAGATAYSRSNPGISFTSLGNGMVSRTNAETGVTYNMSPGEYNAGGHTGRGGKSGKK